MGEVNCCKGSCLFNYRGSCMTKKPIFIMPDFKVNCGYVDWRHTNETKESQKTKRS